MPIVYDPDLLDLLEALEESAFDGVVWRHMFNDYNPTRSNTRGARWNPPDVAAIYTSLERDVAMAEADYALASQPLRPRASRQLYKVRVTLAAVVDITDPMLLLRAGISDEQLASPNHVPCQTVGGAAHWLGYDGLLVPSARAPGNNLVVFTDRTDVDAVFDILSREELAAEA